MQHTPRAHDPLTLTNGLSCDRLAYADDADLLGETFEGRDQQLDDFDGAGRRVGLEIKEQKTKAMKTGRDPRSEDYIELGEYLLEELDEFKYLGSIVQNDNGMDAEIQARIGGASKCSWAVNSLLRSRHLTRTTKLQVYTTMIRPVLSYACETWALTKELERKLLVFERSVLRRILGPVIDDETGQWRRRHNYELRDVTRLPPITNYVRAQRLRWAGHVARMDEGSLLRRILDGRPEGRRPPGRPRLRWSDCVRNDLALLQVDNPDQWIVIAQDRRRWKLLVRAAKDHPGPPLPE